jgi:hypothetical protein
MNVARNSGRQCGRTRRTIGVVFRAGSWLVPDNPTLIVAQTSVKPISRSQWNGGFGAHSRPSRRAPRRRAFRPIGRPRPQSATSAKRRFQSYRTEGFFRPHRLLGGWWLWVLPRYLDQVQPDADFIPAVTRSAAASTAMRKVAACCAASRRVPYNIVLRTRARRLPSDKRAGPSLRKAQPGLLPRWPTLAAARRRALAERP